MMNKKHILQSNLYACSRKTESTLYFWYKVTVFGISEVKTAALSKFYLHQHKKLTANIGNLTDKFVRRRINGFNNEWPAQLVLVLIGRLSIYAWKLVFQLLSNPNPV